MNVRLRHPKGGGEFDKFLMENLISFLGWGRIQEDLKRSVVNFIVTKHKDIAKVIIPIFNQHPLMSSKHLEFKDFCEVSSEARFIH
jgi:hypothetical protein